MNDADIEALTPKYGNAIERELRTAAVGLAIDARRATQGGTSEELISFAQRIYKFLTGSDDVTHLHSQKQDER